MNDDPGASQRAAPKARGRAEASGISPELAFTVLNEANIVAQLSSALLEARLPKGMVAAQFGVINHLASRPAGQTPLQLARAFQVPKTSMTHSIAMLARHGLVETLPNPADGRSKLVRITEAGHALRTATIAALEPDIRRNLGALEPGTLEALLPALQHLRRVLDAARDASPPGRGEAGRQAHDG
jgi:DNA-binding MarR family transcriptional regulator